MRKQVLILTFHLGAGFFIWYEARDLILAYYLLSPILILPIFYFYKRASWFFFSIALAGVIAMHVGSGASGLYPRLVLFWLFQPLLFLLLGDYLGDTRATFQEAEAGRDEVRANLENLQAKFQTRLSSLRHLEQQVGSLMNLFEIARDFSECMDFSVLTEFLLKKLRSELTFQRMRILIVLKPSPQKAPGLVKVYDMAAEGVVESERELTAEEKIDFETMKNSKAMVRRDQIWYFPVFEAGGLGAVFSIEGVKEDDLARVEVLSAYLVLLIKKIKLYETVRELAIIDELTQFFVRHHFVERLEEEIKRSIRFKLPLAVLMLDIDHFKRYNDEFGHLVGDATLTEVASLLRKSLRRMDLVGRYGGEEFVVAMPETRLGPAAEAAERIRSNIARHDFQVYDDKTKVTVSQGVEIFDPSELADPERADPKKIAVDLIQHVDEAMYRAKDEGRNRVCLFKDMKKSL